MTHSTVVTTKPVNVSPWSPFKHTAFTLLWTASLISNIGSWMHDIGAGWLMTTLSPSPSVVTLVQAASTLPIFLFVLFAGALADRVDKKRLLIGINFGLVGIIGAFSALVFFDFITPLLLVVFTFAIGTCTAFMAPAWQAVVPSLVPRDTLQPAIALNSMGINISRAIGPALGGFLIAAVGIAAPFFLNALSCVVIIIAVWLWKPEAKQETRLPPQPFMASIATGLRHSIHNKALRATLLRAFGFFTFSSAYWAMLPLVARSVPNASAEFYGLMLTSIGAGAVGGAFLLPTVRKRLSLNAVAITATLLTAVSMAMMALFSSPIGLIVAALCGGASWIGMLTSLNVSAQTALPDWVRARGLALFLMVFSGCMAAGSILWGQVAEYSSISVALLCAAVGIVLILPFILKAKLGQGEDLDLTPALAWPEPVTNMEMSSDRGPVMVTTEYIIDPNQETDFLLGVSQLSHQRYGNGAFDWGIYQDAEHPERWTEWFLDSSWAEHLHHHKRTSIAEDKVHAEVRAFHVGSKVPAVRHFLAPKKDHTHE